MIRGLFKPAWQSDSVEKRLNTILELDVLLAENQTIFENLAANDVDAGVRHAAMGKILEPQILFDFWQSHPDTNSRQIAETAFGNLIHSRCAFSEAEFKDFLGKNPGAMLAIAKNCPHATLRNELLLSLDEAEQAKHIADVAFSDTRSVMAHNICDLTALEIARKNLRGRDKNAEKIIKAKIDALHAKLKTELENAELAKSLREKMEVLAGHEEWREETKTQFSVYSKRWKALEFEPSDDEKQRYHKAFCTVDADVKHNLALTNSRIQQEKIVATLEAKCLEISGYSLDKLLTQSLSLADELSNLSQQWSNESEIFPHTLTTSERFIKASKAIEAALSLTQSVNTARENQDAVNPKPIHKQAQAIVLAAKSSDWPDSHPPLIAASEAILEAELLISNSEKECKQAIVKLEKLHIKINRILGTTKRGDIARARRELTSAVKAANHYAGTDRIRLDERLQEATDAVKKMGDWKDFATEPKLIELCEEMERLAKITQPNGDKQAAKITKLQQVWKALGSSDVADKYWPRFKEAADTAYEPCAAFFKQRRSTQRENLKQREPLIAQMKQLFEATNWDDQTDYKSVEEKLRQIMQAWQKIKNVEQGSGQKQWLKFSKIKEKIYEKLDLEYDKNITLKNSLIEQLEQMLEQDIGEQSLGKLQLIQSKWKQIGLTRRKQDQAAWKKFKLTSDAVYGKIQGLRQAKRADEDEQISAYTQICKQIMALAKSAQDLAQSDKEFETLEQSYKELPALPRDLPEKLIERLSKDYDRACQSYAMSRTRVQKAQLDQQFEILRQKAQLCAELEQLPVDVSSDAVQQLLHKIDALELANKDTAKRFAERLSKARDRNREGYSKARQTLLIEAEILMDIESPKEDRAVRMQIQLDKMKSKGIGHALIDKSKAIKDLNLNWLCMPGAEADLQNQFDKRFGQLLKTQK